MKCSTCTANRCPKWCAKIYRNGIPAGPVVAVVAAGRGRPPGAGVSYKTALPEDRWNDMKFVLSKIAEYPRGQKSHIDITNLHGVLADRRQYDGYC